MLLAQVFAKTRFGSFATLHYVNERESPCCTASTCDRTVEWKPSLNRRGLAKRRTPGMCIATRMNLSAPSCVLERGFKSNHQHYRNAATGTEAQFQEMGNVRFCLDQVGGSQDACAGVGRAAGRCRVCAECDTTKYDDVEHPAIDTNATGSGAAAQCSSLLASELCQARIRISEFLRSLYITSCSTTEPDEFGNDGQAVSRRQNLSVHQ